MQNVIVAKIQRYVPDTLDARVVLPLLVGEKDAIPPLQIVGVDVFALLDLRARVDVEKLPRALIEDILDKGRAVEFLHGKA